MQVFQSWRMVHLMHQNQTLIQEAVHAEVRVGLLTHMVQEFIGGFNLLKEKGYSEWIEQAATGDDMEVTVDRMRQNLTLRKKEKKVTWAKEPSEQRKVKIMMSKWAQYAPHSWTSHDPE